MPVVMIPNDQQPEFLTSCPTYLIYKAQGIAEIFQYHMHWEKSQLGLCFPDGVPVAVMRAIEQMEFGLRKGKNERLEDERKKREQKKL